jgi:hypothetical protein
MFAERTQEGAPQKPRGIRPHHEDDPQAIRPVPEFIARMKQPPRSGSTAVTQSSA